ncbi:MULTISPECIES: NAD(P)H-dependent oxidoreductase [Rhizobium]|uniref:NAD(P)H dehydrogenase (Quinone) n=1 Tax=Rhizobium tropici TaxID=398 RepID=A0A6P1CFW0_RHITR|nr:MULTISPECIES: NAD(P)H-dependent oxidoreductase [Rhizobium]AGB72579.1 NAD(P)H dehydrogenase [Rhizobium tropici CIAT 899]MBB4244735.1 NAD(P)H dehydrogenase (quinone) [Rhizobium tropici]MBB5596122.1 NAD(P)H dehydrogenase (quinone) [Rhizobium tropici]MBB6495134.1 NAD(P)H dehydrogenase (quinone) [Rhizobium tropici]NEV13694.1 NAD(P)H-dependent oxidoreductase [Rhizobium tropici]
MHALIVLAHPKPDSFSHSVATKVAEGVTASGATFEIADLTAEGFDPRFSVADIAAHLREGPSPDDVVAEQARIDRADALVLVYPVYWWSMPGLLKGWIDRVFTNGWAYDDMPGDRPIKRLRHLRVHLVAIGGATMRTYARHGYFGAMKMQIDHGIFGYCGAPVATSELLLTEAQDMTSHLDTARAIGQNLFATSRSEKAVDAA